VDPRDGRARRELLGRWTPHVGENDNDADGYSEQEKSGRSQGGVRKVAFARWRSQGALSA
jgi:hypothetical protein